MGWFVLWMGIGCQGEDPVGYYEDVKPILDGRCAGCHQGGGVAPFNLASYDEAALMAEAIAASTAARQMPPWGVVEGHRSYRHDPSLTPEQLTVLQQWAVQGAPEGNPSAEGAPLPSVGQVLPRTDILLEMPQAYTPTITRPDDYRCFVLDWPLEQEQYVTGFDIQPGNPEVVHHVAAYLVAPDGLMGDGIFDTIARWDASEDGPGYTCFGGPSSSTSGGTQIPIEQLAQWVPGFGAQIFPDDTGILVQPGSQVILQLHYNTAAGTGADQTAMALMTETAVPDRAQFAPVLDALWPISGMEVPAGQITTHDVQLDPRAFFSLLNSDAIDLDDGFQVHSSLLHMHRLGTHGIVSIEHPDGSSDVFLEVSPYDFDWQLNYQLQEPATFLDGDQVRLECTFDNTQGTADVNWGEGSDEEMCVANLFISAL